MERQKGQEQENKDWVLDYFIDPKNELMGYGKFGQMLTDAAIGNGNSPVHQNIRFQMAALMNELKDARKFDSTYIGHMLSEASIPAMIAFMEATRLGGNTVAPEVSKMETKLEPEGIQFLLNLVGYDKEKASGTFTSGGSMAVFTALTVARKRIQEKHENKKSVLNAVFPDRDKSPNKLCVFTTPMVHYCFHKAVDFLGGQNRGIQTVSVATKGFKMDPEDLERKLKEYKRQGKEIMAVYAIAGETEAGLVDPLKAIAEISHKYGVFTIADAAYGAPYRWSRNGKLFEGLPDFDAVIIDGHKALYTPYPNGAVLFKDANDHVLFGRGVDAAYVQMSKSDKDFLNALLYNVSQTKEEKMENAAINYMLGKKRPEGSGSAGSILSTVATKRTLGEVGLRAVYDITLDRIDHLNEILKHSKYLKPFHEPEVNVLCFTLNEKAEAEFGFPKEDALGKTKANNERRKKILESVRRIVNLNSQGKNVESSDRGSGYFLSSTDLPTDKIDPEETKKQKSEQRIKHWVLRAVLMNPRTSNQTLDEVVAKMDYEIGQLISSKKI